MPKLWDPHEIQTLIRLRKAGMTFVQIGRFVGRKPHTVGVKYKKLMGHESSQIHTRPSPPDPEPAKPRQIGIHLEDYNRARRGFHVPAEQEGEYFELLLKGIPIAEAARRLGLSSHSSP